MDTKKPMLPSVRFLDETARSQIYDTALKILAEVGIRIDSPAIRDVLSTMDDVELVGDVATYSETAIRRALELTPGEFQLYGRDASVALPFRPGEQFLSQSIAGEYAIADLRLKQRRDPTLDDLADCVHLADALPNVDIVGAMVQPTDIPVPVRDIHIIAEMLKRTRKPVRTWIHNAISAHFVLELFEVVAGGPEQLRSQPRGLLGFEPTSPLMLSRDALETMQVWVGAGQPVSIGPIVQSMGTGPMTPAGTLAQQTAEILAALVIVQALAPGVGTVYFNASLMLDPRSGSTLFASPQHTLMMGAGIQLAHWLGLPAGAQLGLSDAKLPDAQAGWEKSLGLLMGGMCGLNLTSGLGISGCDQAASLPQLVVDDEITGYVRKIMNGLLVNDDTCAFEAIARIGIGGNFLADKHTLEHVRDQWIPRLSDRNTWEGWLEAGGSSLGERAADEALRLLATTEADWLDEDAQKELDRIVAAADREILGI